MRAAIRSARKIAAVADRLKPTLDLWEPKSDRAGTGKDVGFA
jgi:hypothetical protein